MSTKLKKIKTRDGDNESEIILIVFAGANKLVEKYKEETCRCVQVVVKNKYKGTFTYVLSDSALKAMAEQLQSVVDRQFSSLIDRER